MGLVVALENSNAAVGNAPAGVAGIEALKHSLWPHQAEAFETLLAAETAFASKDLHEAVRHQVLAGGKRLRAVLPAAVAAALDPAVNVPPVRHAALWAGLAAELLHCGTLSQDDVMDGDDVRRDRPSVWAAYGVPQAICAGDLLFFLAEEALDRAGLPDEGRVAVQRDFSRCVRRLSHGQALEFALRRDGVLPDLDVYEELAVNKTGALFALCLLLGGHVAGAPAAVLASLEEVGLLLGLFFQVQDDLLDVIGDKGRGARRFGDLWEGKPSALVAAVADAAHPAVRAELAALLYKERRAKTADDVQALRLLLDENDAVAAAFERLSVIAGEARERTAQRLPELVPVADSLLERMARPLLVPGPSTVRGS